MPGVGARFHVGYTTTGNFTMKDGSSAHIAGYEYGVEFPVFKLGGSSINLYPSALIPKKNSSNSSGKVWRFLLIARQNLPGTQLYTFYAAGVSYTQAEAGAFDDVSAFETQVGGGLPLTGLLGKLSPAVEVAYHNANKGQIKGFTIGVNVSF